ncbi:hypothetical protein ACEPAI_2405 [Sanghuangporus weigelae]
MVIFEFSAAILLTVRSMLEFRIGGAWRFDSGSFFTVVFKQGIIYFAVVSIFTMAAVVLNFEAPVSGYIAGTFFQRLPNAYTLPLSCTLIARFLLQLREWQEKTFVMTGDGGQDLTTQDHPQTLTSMRANTIVDSIILSDFGDGSPAATGTSRSAWDTVTHEGKDEKSHTDGRPEAIALHDIHVETGDEENRNEVKT